MTQHRSDVMPIHIRDEMKTQIPVRHGIKRRKHHLRPEVAAPDTQVDDIPDAAGLDIAYGLRKVQHVVQHTVHQLTVWPLPLGHTKGRVQHRSALGEVDGLPLEHGIAAQLNLALVAQVEQELQNLGIHMVLGQVGKYFRCLQAQRLKTLRITLESIAQVECFSVRFKVRIQREPSRGSVTTWIAHQNKLIKLSSSN